MYAFFLKKEKNKNLLERVIKWFLKKLRNSTKGLECKAKEIFQKTYVGLGVGMKTKCITKVHNQQGDTVSG